MKKTIFLVAAFLFTTILSQAQTEKGNQTLGLNLGFSFGKNNGVINSFDGSTSVQGSKSISFNIGPSYSYFIGDKLDLGATLAYNQTNSTYPEIVGNISKTSAYTFLSMVYLRKYWMFTDKLGLRAGPYLAYEKGNDKDEYFQSISSVVTKIDYYGAGAKFDLVYYPSKKLGFAASIANVGYSHMKTNTGNQHTSGDSVGLNLINNNLALSVFCVFGGK